MRQRRADLDGGGARGEEGARVVGGRDPAAADDLDVGQVRMHLGHAAQRERPDRRTAEATRPPVGESRGQRVADHDHGGTRVDDRPGRLHDPHQVGPQLGQHG